jgi:AcrR family transcriptional regulator
MQVIETEIADPIGARERGRMATRARLLTSGRELFAANGLHRVTSHEIAKGAGVAAGTFYLHFSDKKSLFREIVYAAVEQLRSRLEAAQEQASQSRAAVRAHAEALVSFAEENADLVRIVFGRNHEDPDLESEILDELAGTGAVMIRTRMESGSANEALDPQLAAQALTGMFSRVIFWWLEDPSRASREAVVNTLVAIQTEGVYSD